MKLFAGGFKGRADAVFLFFGEGRKDLTPVAQEVDAASRGGVRKILDLGFKGKRKECELLVLPGGRWKLAVMLGLGEPKKIDSECFREAAATGLKRISRYSAERIEIELIAPGEITMTLAEEARAIGEACWLATYHFGAYRKFEDKAPKKIHLLGDAHEIGGSVRAAEIVGSEHCFVRDLCNMPGLDLYPERFASEARKSAKQFGLKVKVFDEKALQRMGYHGILRVGQGSRRQPRMVVLRYNGAGAKSPWFGLVGKGVTFDTGGISLKDPGGMEQMKGDMTGAAVVLGVMRAAARLKLKLNLVAVLPLAENMPGGNAQRPGDVLRMADGTTVEVISTDAEGRLILADALYHCRKLKVRQMIDIATLTGACMIALGRFAIGLMGTDEDLLARISEAGLKAGERCWMLPLWAEYQELIRGDISDLRNIGRGREAGTILGGTFLKRFAADTPWAHLDIASTDWSEENHTYLGRGPTGKGLRLLVRFLQDLEGKFKS